jgi:seryl-tRNA synthetase
MFDINLLREDPELVRKALQTRQVDGAVVDQVLYFDTRRRSLIQEVEVLKAERNNVSREIGRMKSAGERQARIEEMRLVGNRISALDKELETIQNEQNYLLSTIPNLPLEDTPYGVDDSENIILRAVGPIPEFDFSPLPHWELGQKLEIINFEQGVKITGSRFYAPAARLDRLDARPAHPPGLHRKIHSLYGARGDPLCLRTVAKVRRQPLPRPRGRPVDGTDGRGAADRPAQR